ncbi:MAG: nucleotidyl transferase [Sphingomonas bacterium]|uniref:nucleotidyltransferase family protein n=1 Tax=Sphingomonas bacterium TaxID=1895847 RepID=UPI002636A7DA|nr:nucleotidyltransferase family protein [Sphingomonas bacterium]MDB5704821.1 nucleotidyl transferase [Sphingomonas bacterium]
MTAKRTLHIRPDPGGEVPKTAMVMAAGLGTRMRPLSATRPKPLIKIGGTTFIDHVLDHLRAAGVSRIVVNAHYLADMLEAHLATNARDLDVVISDERGQLLDTGGGLVKALPLIDADPFLCVNTDNIWVDGPLDSLKLMAQTWDDARMDVLMLLIPQARAHYNAGRGDFHLDQLGRLWRRRPARVAPYVWTGIQMLSKRLIVDPPSEVFSTNVFWDRAIAAGRAYGLVHQGLWFDVGTPGAIPKTEAMLADG